ncbi:hypothetical protein HA402_006218 [Bradysia odoriphaga]|nr:hypothetical protein HA402_006218 [Bradysia odoriphaga]
MCTNVVGAISECVRFQNNRETLRVTGGLPLIVNLLNGTHAPLLENCSKALTECAKDPESMAILEEMDAVRLIWSLLKNPNPRVQAYAAYALCPCIENAKDSGDLVRSLVGAMELVVGLMKSTDTLVLSAVCSAIATIAKNKENLAILSDHKSGVVPFLLETVGSKDRELQEASAGCLQNIRKLALRAEEFTARR